MYYVMAGWKVQNINLQPWSVSSQTIIIIIKNFGL